MTGLKRAVTLAQRNREREVNRVGDDQVRLTVAVKVAGRQRLGTGARGVVHVILKGAVALAQQNRN